MKWVVSIISMILLASLVVNAVLGLLYVRERQEADEPEQEIYRVILPNYTSSNKIEEAEEESDPELLSVEPKKTPPEQ